MQRFAELEAETQITPYKKQALCSIWPSPLTRKSLLEKLANAGYGKEELSALQNLVNAEKSDLFDVLEYIALAIKPITRESRVAFAKPGIFSSLEDRHQDFVNFVLAKYIETGVDELDDEKLPSLLELKYNSISDATLALGEVKSIRDAFIKFQQHLYSEKT